MLAIAIQATQKGFDSWLRVMAESHGWEMARSSNDTMGARI